MALLGQTAALRSHCLCLLRFTTSRIAHNAVSFCEVVSLPTREVCKLRLAVHMDPAHGSAVELWVMCTALSWL